MRKGILGTMSVVVALFWVPAAQASAAPPALDWESLLPALVAPGDQPNRLAECRHVRISCVDDVARHLGERADALGCDHRAIFARNYQRLTQVLRSYIARPRFFSNRRFLIKEDVLFARLFFRAYDGGFVPEAWQIAFDAWRQGDTIGVQDLLLGINAHVQRDMPYVVAAMGLGSKSDHDAVNQVLDAAYGPIVDEVTRRYDPLTSIFASPVTPIDDEAAGQLIRTWREGVWRHAEQLVAARNPAALALVKRGIEANAAATARVLAVPRYPGYGVTRDAYCATHAG